MDNSFAAIFNAAAMNVRSRIGPEGKARGSMDLAQGLLISGSFEGDLRIIGDMLVDEGARFGGGKAVIHGDLYIAGFIGLEALEDQRTLIECRGRVYAGEVSEVRGVLRCGELILYKGNRMNAMVETGFRFDAR